MNQQQFENLAKRWPDVFQKSGEFELSIGDGWYNIIDTLLSLISNPVENAKRRLDYALKNQAALPTDSVSEREKALADEIEKLPTIVQVKEKFGTLRFYVDGGTRDAHNYITFAEVMSGQTCEVCGSPGKSRPGSGWIRVLCDTHSDEQDEHNRKYKAGLVDTKSMKLSDDDDDEN